MTARPGESGKTSGRMQGVVYFSPETLEAKLVWNAAKSMGIRCDLCFSRMKRQWSYRITVVIKRRGLLQGLPGEGRGGEEGGD